MADDRLEDERTGELKHYRRDANPQTEILELIPI
jgi:hypothetical protein